MKTLLGEGKNAGNQHFFFPHHAFYPMKDKFNVLERFTLLCANAFNLDKAITSLSGKGLNLYKNYPVFQQL